MGNYRRLEVWQRAQALAARIDRESRLLARGYSDLADQLRRASLSIATNIAEGANKGRDGDFARYVDIAIGSAAEVDSLLDHARAVGAFRSEAVDELVLDVATIRKMLFGLRRYLAGSRTSDRARRPPTPDHRPTTSDQ